METLKGDQLRTVPWPTLVRIGDLINFEAPMLTLFVDQHRQALFLYDWVDSDSLLNRWLIFQVEPWKLLDFIHRRISHYELFTTPADPYYYAVDIDGDLNFTPYRRLRANQVPQTYFPEKEVFFDPADCPNLSKLTEFLSSLLPTSGTQPSSQVRRVQGVLLSISPELRPA